MFCMIGKASAKTDLQEITICSSMPLGARRAYYGKVRAFLSAA